MGRSQYGRHLPAFILLFLAKEPAYGLILLNKMEQALPYNKADSAAVYRALQELEKLGSVESYWDTSEPGPAKKWYKITAAGLQQLAEFKTDIEQRIQNLHYFLNEYTNINPDK